MYRSTAVDTLTYLRYVGNMDISKEIGSQWAARQKEIEVVWWLLPRTQPAAADDEEAAKLQRRITACLLMTPFPAESGQQVGAALAQRFGLQLEKLGRLQQLLAEQLLRHLNEQQVAWLAPRLMAFWAQMTVGCGRVWQQLYADEQATQQEKVLTEFQQLTTQAAESDGRFEALFTSSYHPVVLLENGRILAINHAVTQKFGYTAADLIGKTVQSLMQTITLPAEQTKIIQQIEGEQERPYRTQCLTKAGTAVAVQATARHVAYQGRTVRMVILRPSHNPNAPAHDSESIELTPRQETTLRLMAQGFSDKEIAQKLGVSPSTVNHHKSEIFKKIQANSRNEAIAWAWQNIPAVLHISQN